jgi:collagen type III alpha
MSSGVEIRPTKSPKFVAVIDESLGQVQRRIRLADLSRGLLALTALTFGYLLVAIGFDLASGGASILATAVRLGLFGVFAIAFLLLGGWTLWRYLTRVNPYFAARRLEETIPDAKNSLINWLDLRNETKIPPAIYQAVGLRAARDAEAADPELVVSTKESTRLGITIGVLTLALGVMFLFAPIDFRSLLSRAASPWRAAPIPPPTTITLVKPVDGDAEVGANQRFDIVALIEGRIADTGAPEAPAIRFRNDPTDLEQRAPLEEGKDNRWSVRLTPEQIRSGLTYRLTAGAASTPEHRLTVRTQPYVQEFKVTYHFREYRKARPETVVYPNMAAHVPTFLGHRGTDVDLVIRANTAIVTSTAYLDFETAGKRNLVAKGEPLAGDPKSIRFRFTLVASGTVRVQFEAPGGERNLDREPYEVHVLDDKAPSVILVEPGKDMAAPANGTLLLVGKAYDEFGVTGLTLQVKVPGKKELVSQPYLGGKSFKFPNGTYPLAIKYYDTLHLDKLQLPAGTELEYWLEATDNCDYPKANVGKSATYKLKLITPDDPTNQKAKREKAETQAKAGQQKQDDQGGKDKSENGGNKEGQGEGSGQNGSSPNQEKAEKDKLEKDIGDTAKKLADAGANQSDNKDPSNSGDSNPKDSNPKGDSSKGDSSKGDSSKGDSSKGDSSKGDSSKGDSSKGDSSKGDSSKGDSSKGDSSKGDSSKGNSGSQPKGDNPGTKPDPGKSESANNDSPKEKSPANSGDAKSQDPNSGNSPNEKKSENAKPKDGNSGDSSGAGDAPKDAKSDKVKDDKKSPSSDAGNATNGNSGDEKKENSNAGKEKEPKKGDAAGKGSESETGSKSKGSTPENSPGPMDTASKEGTGNGDGPSKATTKKDDATKGEGKVDKEGSTEELKQGKAPNANKSSDPNANSKGNPSDAKNDKKNAKDNPSGKQPEPTAQEIQMLGKLLKEKSPEADKMAKDLVQRGLDMKDADNKKALENALKDAGREDDVNKLNGEEKLPAPMPMNAGDAPMPTPKEDGKSKASGAIGKKDGDGKKGNDPAANTGGGPSYEEELKKITPDAEFRRKLGNLQIENIEDLKRRITKEVRDKAGVSDPEWQQFLKNAAEYQRYLERHRPAPRADAKTLTGGNSTIAGPGVQAVESRPGAQQSSTEGAAVSPPLEFRDAQRDFTRGKRDK